MYKLIILLTIWQNIQAQDLCIRGYLHEKSTFSATDLKPWSRVAIDTSNAILYYISERANATTNSIRYLKLPELQGDILIDFVTPYQITVDRHTGILYIVAGNDTTTALHLYKYESKNKTAVLLAEKVGDRDSFLYKFYAFRDRVYWIGGDGNMHRYSSGRIGKHNILMEAYAEDDEGTVYFIKQRDERHVFKVRSGEKDQRRFISKDFVAVLRPDSNGVIVAGSIITYRLYDISEQEGRLVLASDELPSSPTNLHFDEANDIIYVEKENEFGKLTRTLKTCQYNELANKFIF